MRSVSISSTMDVSPSRVDLGEAPSRVVLDVPFRVIAKILLSVLVFSIAVSLLDSVRTVLIWLGMAVFIAIALNPAVSGLKVDAPAPGRSWPSSSRSWWDF